MQTDDRSTVARDRISARYTAVPGTGKVHSEYCGIPLQRWNLSEGAILL